MNEYESAIDALIPRAYYEAKAKVDELGYRFESRVVGGKSYRHCMLTEFFHAAMNRLAKDIGVRNE